MPRQAIGAAPLLITIDGRRSEPLNRQLYRGLREAIFAGRLAPGARLPSTRALAGDLELSRNTVLAAFEQLAAEGYLDARVGAGTRVAGSLPDDLLRAPAPAGPAAPLRAARPRPASRRGQAIAAAPRRASYLSGRARAFTPGQPAVDDFPTGLWARLAARRSRRVRASEMAYGDAAGYRPLREAIAAYLRASRGVRCDADGVIVVSGSQQGLDLAARVLLDPGDQAWLEDPGYHGARGAFVAAGARVVPVPVDEEGIVVDEGRRRAPRARLVHVCPSHQFPLGVTMTLARRFELLRWAAAARAWIVEDDCDSEFRYASRPLAALQGLDAESRVVYVGTFSKVLFPALRLAYVVPPPDLRDAFLAARTFADSHSPTLAQAVLADFMDGGHFESHIRRMRALYEERQAVLVEAARQELAGLLEVRPAQAGLHLTGWLPRGADDDLASRRAAEHGVDALRLSFFRIRPGGRGGLVLGYSGVDGRAIREGVRSLAAALAGPR